MGGSRWLLLGLAAAAFPPKKQSSGLPIQVAGATLPPVPDRPYPPLAQQSGLDHFCILQPALGL